MSTAPPQGYQTAPPPAPPMWVPMPAAQPRRDLMPMLAMWLRLIGFLVVFVGVLVAVVAVSTPGSHFTNPCSTSTACTNEVAGYANGVIAAKVLFLIGLLMVGGGAGIKLHWGLRAPAPGHSDEQAWVLADRRFNGLLFIVSIALMALVLITINTTPIAVPTIP